MIISLEKKPKAVKFLNNLNTNLGSKFPLEQVHFDTAVFRALSESQIMAAINEMLATLNKEKKDTISASKFFLFFSLTLLDAFKKICNLISTRDQFLSLFDSFSKKFEELKKCIDEQIFDMAFKEIDTLDRYVFSKNQIHDVV